ncbi:hypothetical protein [Carp edema virus]|nr:hypothetical protein [Carp edema virus]
MGTTNYDNEFDDEKDILIRTPGKNEPDFIVVKKPKGLVFDMESFDMNYYNMEIYERNGWDFDTVRLLENMLKVMLDQKNKRGAPALIQANTGFENKCSFTTISINGMEYHFINAGNRFARFHKLYKIRVKDYKDIIGAIGSEIKLLTRSLEIADEYKRVSGFKIYETTKKTIYLNYNLCGSSFSTLIFPMLEIELLEVNKVFCYSQRSLIWIARCRCIGADLENKFRVIKKMAEKYNNRNVPLIWESSELITPPSKWM